MTAPPSALDRMGRPLSDLRISVTDRCNFRCVYCMPGEAFNSDCAFLARREVLDFEEIARIARVLVGLGVRKIRLTGGEPLVRRDLPVLVSTLTAIDGLAEVVLTTNGSLLAPLAGRLRDAGLTRVTVSLDARDEDTFRVMSGADCGVERVVAGMRAAAAVGLAPVKVNMVVKRGMNDAAVLPMARFARDEGFVLRLIEYMDVGRTNGWRIGDVVTADELLAVVSAVFPLEAALPADDGAVAARYRYLDGGGELGIIAAVTRPFCRGCTRLRLAADGRVYTCLFAESGHDLRASLRRGATDQELAAELRGIWGAREDRYSALRAFAEPGRRGIEMFRMGG